MNVLANLAILVWTFYLVLDEPALVTADSPIDVTVTDIKARRCPGANQRKEKIEVIDDSVTYKMYRSSSRYSLKIDQTASKKFKKHALRFPACYNFDFDIRIKKRLYKPEAKVSIWQVSNLKQLDCSGTEIQKLGDHCETGSGGKSCKVCDVCHRIRDLDDDLRKTKASFDSQCARTCCFANRSKPYQFSLDRLCINRRNMKALFEEADVSIRSLRNQRKKFGRRGEDAIRMRLQFTDEVRRRTVKNDNNKDDRTSHRVRLPGREEVGCFELTIAFTIDNI